MGCILALDQGTTSSRAVVFDETQNVLGLAQQPYEQIFPQPGWVEHDPHAIWRTQRETIDAALADAALTAADIAAIGITNQRETVVLWDRRTGEPIHNAIVWQDGRTAAECDRLREAGHEPAVQQKTGLLLDPYFSASKIRWLLDHCRGAAEAAVAGHLAFGTIDTWLIWHLTGGREHVTDPTNASRTALFNIHDARWDEELLSLWGIPRSLLPEIVPSSGDIAKCSLPGLEGVPIAGIAGDQQAALFGQACFAVGEAKCTYGTGCFMLLNCGEQPVMSEQRLLTSIAWQIDGKLEYALEGSVFTAGAAVQWLRDGLGIIDAAADVETLAAGVASSDGVVVVPAFTGLGAPYWDPRARGAILGMTRGTTAAHIARATLEGIAFQVADVLGAMHADTGARLRQLKVDGGASSNALLMQMQADVLDVPLLRPRNQESTALGCAALAGLAVGVWRDRDELRRLAITDATFTPDPAAGELDRQRQLWAKAVSRSRGWADSDPAS